MKTAILITILGLIFCIQFLQCKGKHDLTISVNNDRKLLRIIVDGYKDGKEINYKQSFKTEGLSKAQKDSIVHHVFDSLHVGVNELN